MASLVSMAGGRSFCLHQDEPGIPGRYNDAGGVMAVAPPFRPRARGEDMPAEDIQPVPEGAGLYVDLENLHADAQVLVKRLIENWPDKAPALSRLALYVRADQVELWRLWVASRFPDLDLAVSGTQHFSMSATKNSADIAIATHAMADLALGRVSHVVVFSDDSDFISLYAAIRDEPEIPLRDGKVPFLWVITDRDGSVSGTVRQFFPPEQLHLVSAGGTEQAGPSRKAASATAGESPAAKSQTAGTPEEMARFVVERIEVGQFKSTECQKIIKERWPKHSLASAGGGAFGIEFKNNLWPVLKGLGVKIRNPGKKPIKYEMTEEAKLAVGESG